jgi:hypothetical protein
MRQTESYKSGHLGGTQIDQSAKAVEAEGCRRAQAKVTLAVVAVMAMVMVVRTLQLAGWRVIVRLGEKLVWPQVLEALVKQRVVGTSLGTAISDSASKVSRSGSAA